MKKAALLLVLAAMLVGGVPVLADGMFYWPESVPPEIPYQRALLMFDGSHETLVVQSKYRMSSSATGEFGWVVPVPSVPELASMEPDLAGRLFEVLSRASQPDVTEISSWLVVPIAVFVAPAAGILLLVLLLASFASPRLRFIRRRRVRVRVVIFLLFWTSALGWLSILLMGNVAGGVDTVYVVRAEDVGIYDVQVVKAGEAGDLIQWLNENRFQFHEEDAKAFDEYLRRGWYFVVARVDPTRSSGEGIVAEGLVAPLILRFETDVPVCPLALTATAGHDTQVLLYVLSQRKWQNGGRLGLEYAGEVQMSALEEVCRQAEPEPPTGCLEAANLPYLSKFLGTLTPAQMEQDLVLTPADDDKPYRKHIIEW